jgi:hypothetical protein
MRDEITEMLKNRARRGGHLFLSNWEEVSLSLYHEIRADSDLAECELAGLTKGEKRQKKPNVPIEILFYSLQKQWRDFEKAYRKNADNNEEVKKCLADIRNVAGILFLNLKGRFSASEKKKET